MQIDRRLIATYGAARDKVQAEAGREARNGVKAWLSAHGEWKAEQLREASIAIVQDVVDKYGAAVASLACDMYENAMADGQQALMWTGDFREKVRKAVKYQLRKALGGDEDAYLTAIQEMAEYYVHCYFNETAVYNVEVANGLHAEGAANVPQQSHSVALKKGDVAYARVPTGAETCAYCLMLASRGFAYRSAESAGHADHRGCNCMIVAGHKGDTVEGVDQDALYRCWRDLEDLKARVEGHEGEYTQEEIERMKNDIVAGYGDSIKVSTNLDDVKAMYS